jgi:citrate lyase subunit beta/citryl-CoA lyase
MAICTWKRKLNYHDASHQRAVKVLPAVTAPLFVPASRRDRFAKAATSGADAIIVDHEDAVPANLKDEARANLGSIFGLAVPAFVSINAEGTPWHAGESGWQAGESGERL